MHGLFGLVRRWEVTFLFLTHFHELDISVSSSHSSFPPLSSEKAIDLHYRSSCDSTLTFKSGNILRPSTLTKLQSAKNIKSLQSELGFGFGEANGMQNSGDVLTVFTFNRRKMRSIFENERDECISRFLGDDFDDIIVSPAYMDSKDENCIRVTGNRSPLSDITNTVSPSRRKMKSVSQKERNVDILSGDTKNMKRVPFSTQNVDELYSIFRKHSKSKKHKAKHDDTLYEVPICGIEEISLRNLTSCEKGKERHRKTRLEHEVDIQYEFGIGSSSERINYEQKLDSENSTDQLRHASNSAVLMSSEIHHDPTYVSKSRKRTRSRGCDAHADVDRDTDSVPTIKKKKQTSKRAPSCDADQLENSAPKMRKRPRRSESESRNMKKGNRKHQISVTNGPLEHGIR
ncbi:hypothetical protein RIF29_38417 [Crotalaria pallida]|uniref:Uncharacterized protein n=1 Tax=Crotalaria pallida TaxID=3830 RepID=A0AAN9E146_CROPI